MKNEKQSQWFNCVFLKDYEPTKSMQGRFKKGQKGFATVKNDGTVILWTGKGFEINFDSIDQAKQYATCLTKCENQDKRIIREFNNIMF